MATKKVVFLGAKPIGYYCFEHLLQQRIKLDIEVTALLTGSRKAFGSHHDLAELAHKEDIKLLSSLDDIPPCDIIYSVQHHEILKPEHIARARQSAVNLHMAPLPEYRGCNQFSFAIIDGQTEFGTTIHRIDARIDHGDILFQRRFAIPANCWVQQLYDLTLNESVSMFKESLEAVIRNNLDPMPQSLLEQDFGTSLHYRNEIDDLKIIDLSWDKEKIERHIRATSMPGFDPPYSLIGDKKVFFSAG